MAHLFEAVRMSLVPEEIRTVEDRIDYLTKRRDELRASSATKGIKSLERRINYLHNRKGALITMLDNYTAKTKGIAWKNPMNPPPPPLRGDSPPTSSTRTDDDPSPPPLKKLKSEDSPGPVAVSDPSQLPPLPFRRPQFPLGGDDEDLQDWVEEVERVSKLNAPRDSLPTHVPSECKCLDDPVTADVVGKDKMMLLPVADVVVSISYPYFVPTIHPAQDHVMSYCSGMIISWDKPNKKARILTCDYIIGRRATKRKLYVRWHYMEDTVFEGELLFFSEHYRIALIEIPVDVQFHKQIPPFASYPKYGDEVFALAREHKELSLMVRRGTVSRLQECYEPRHHFLYVDYELPNCGGGGPVVDRNGDVVGMTLHHSDGCSAILSISTALLCIEMWNKFGRVARPSLGMCFKNAESGGFIVEKVGTDSTAWKLGIRKGNEIVSFHGKCPTPLPGFEDFLLSCGLEHLRSTDLKVWELEVHDLGADVKRKITLHVPFSVVSKGWTG